MKSVAKSKLTVGYPSPRVSSELPDCSLPLTFDQYNMCSYGCLYCFAHVFKKLNPGNEPKPGSLKKPEVRTIKKEVLISAIKGNTTGLNKEMSCYAKHFFKNKFILHWGGLGDPFCGFESKFEVGLKIIKQAAASNYPILFSTKGNLLDKKFKKHMSVFKKSAKQGNFAFQFSMITAKKDLASKIERGVASPKARIKCIEKLNKMGYYTILRFRPFVLGVSDVDNNYMELVKMARDAGIKAISTEFYALNFLDRNNAVWENKLGKIIKKNGGIDDMFEYFKILSPSKRGSYKRLNRDVKERYIRKMYEFCVKNKIIFSCSDPDFKELGMTGSCCGLPDEEVSKKFGIKINPLLFNWSRHQLSNHIIQMRKKFWGGNTNVELRFNDVYPTKESLKGETTGAYKTEVFTKFFDDSHFAQSQPCTIGTQSSFRRGITLRDILLDKWNAQFPYKYFDGKLKPKFVENGNIVYAYQPSDYEYRWIEDGLDLSSL